MGRKAMRRECFSFSISPVAEAGFHLPYGYGVCEGRLQGYELAL